jgi:hypothetical protein
MPAAGTPRQSQPSKPKKATAKPRDDMDDVVPF